MSYSTEEIVEFNVKAHQNMLAQKMNKTRLINNQIANGKRECTILTGLISDTHHTFGDLYDQRAMLFMSICMLHKDRAWIMSYDPPIITEEDVVILGLSTPKGMIMQQYNAQTYWQRFVDTGFRILEESPIWDEWLRNDPDLFDKLQSVMFPSD